MNNHGAIQCKVELLIDGEHQEMRRFQLDDASFASNFDLFMDKLRAVFPQICGKAFKVTWTDADGDVITIANDDDLLMSMMEMNGLKVLAVHINNEPKDEPEEDSPINYFGSVITCDGCNSRITRYRFKCLQCHDYDLCQSCEQGGTHAHHAMMRLVNLEIPRSLHKMVGHCARAARKAAHHAAREAHSAARRANRCGFEKAARAASAASKRCSFRQEAKKGESTSAVNNDLDISSLMDIARSYMMPLGQIYNAAANAHQGQSPNQSTPGSGTATPSTEATSTAEPAKVPDTTNPIPTPGTSVDTFGNLIRDVMSVINTNLAQATKGTSTPSSTPHTAPAAPAAKDDVVLVDSVPTPLPASTATAMEVEAPSPQAPGLIYPAVPVAPDAGWTFVTPPTTQPSAPASTPTQAPPLQHVPINPVEIKYASQLAQLRRMGFADNIDLLGLLKRYNGNIGLVVNHLFERSN